MARNTDGQSRRTPILERQLMMRGFTLVELLVVLSIISVLSALLLPAFLTVRGKAREITCISNLRQIGMSISIYADDYDGLYPYADDPADKYFPQIWSSYPEFETQIPGMAMLHDVLQPYANSRKIFDCPADTGFEIEDFSGLPLDAMPSSFQKFGTSYYYRTEIAARHAGEAMFQTPAELNVLSDGAGQWHGTLVPLTQRYNTLFGDGHTKPLTRAQIDLLWSTPL